MRIGYLRNYTFGLSAPTNVLERVALHVEEIAASEPVDGFVKLVETGSITDFSPIENEQYLVIVTNSDRSCPGFDYIRYGVHAKTIWKTSARSFLIESRLRTDEMSVLACMRNLWFENTTSAKNILIHASLVVAGNSGLLIVGPCHSGKTTLVVRLLTELDGAILVSEGVSLLSRNTEGLYGHYLPRAIYARFSTFFACELLGNFFLRSIERCGATQILDRTTIARIIHHRPANINLGLNMARQRFCEALGVPSVPTAKISKVVFVAYDGSGTGNLSVMPFSEAIPRLSANEFPKLGTFGRIERQPEIVPPETSLLGPAWLGGLSFCQLSYDGWSAISRSLLEDLVM